jgi:transketolase
LHPPFVYPLTEAFSVGGCKQLRIGEHLTLASGGFMLHSVLQAAERLAGAGIHCNVFDAYTLPLDANPILDAARSAGGVILTVEDNYLGGLHAEIAEAAAEAGDVRVVGMTARRIPKSAKTAEEVFSYVGIGIDQILATATRLARS